MPFQRMYSVRTTMACYAATSTPDTTTTSESTSAAGPITFGQCTNSKQHILIIRIYLPGRPQCMLCTNTHATSGATNIGSECLLEDATNINWRSWQSHG